MLLSILLSSVLVANVLGQVFNCGDGWSHYEADNLCFRSMSIPHTFDYAKIECQKIGGELAQFKNQGQQDFALGLNTVVPSYWIGISRDQESQLFKYIDGSSLGEFTPWKTGEPNDWAGSEDCGSVYWYRSGADAGKWNDANCNQKYAFVCSKIPSPCRDGWSYYEADDLCFKSMSSPLSFSYARSSCQALGGDLAQLKNSDQQDFALSLDTAVRSYWLGISRDEDTQQFKYVDGSSLGEYTPWKSGEPNNWNEKEDCGLVYSHYYVGEVGKWNDIICFYTHPYLCSMPPPPCKEGWSYYAADNLCMKSFRVRLSFNDARTKCQELGGDLPQFETEDQQNFAIGLDRAVSYFWVGMSRDEETQEFKYVDGSSLGEFTPWRSGEPNNWAGQEDCVLVFTGSGGPVWNDINCSPQYAYICAVAGP